MGKHGKWVEGLGLHTPGAEVVNGRLKAMREYRLRRRVGFAEIACAVEQVLGGVRGELFGRRGGAGKALAMWAARRHGGLTLRETGEALGGLDDAAVSIAIKRLERKAAESRDVSAQMARIAALLNVET